MSPLILSERSIDDSIVDQQCEEPCANRTLNIRVSHSSQSDATLIDRINSVIEQKIPTARLLVMVEGQSIIFRVHHCQLQVHQSDTLAYRIARLSGVNDVMAELKHGNGPAIYAGKFRGSSHQ